MVVLKGASRDCHHQTVVHVDRSLSEVPECEEGEEGGRTVHIAAQAASSGIQVIFQHTEVVKGHFIGLFTEKHLRLCRSHMMAIYKVMLMESDGNSGQLHCQLTTDHAYIPTLN